MVDWDGTPLQMVYQYDPTGQRHKGKPETQDSQYERNPGEAEELEAKQGNSRGHFNPEHAKETEEKGQKEGKQQLAINHQKPNSRGRAKYRYQYSIGGRKRIGAPYG